MFRRKASLSEDPTTFSTNSWGLRSKFQVGRLVVSIRAQPKGESPRTGQPTCWVDGGVCPDFHAAPRMPILAAVEGGGWKEHELHESMFPACRGQPMFQTSRSRAPSPTLWDMPCDVSTSARSTRLRNPTCLSDTLPLCRRWF